MKKFIVTVKLKRNPAHNPRLPLAGRCPITGEHCTDITGEQHSLIIEARGDPQVRQIMATRGYNHVTRIERIRDEP